MKTLVLFTLTAILLPCWCFADGPNLVANGSFEKRASGGTVPQDWAAAGNRAIRQQLGLEVGRDGRTCARLECADFPGEGPDYHAMVCQSGKVGLQRGRWYRLKFLAKMEGIPSGALDVALVDTQGWQSSGLAQAFSPRRDWQEFDFMFRARRDVPAVASRLQFWFKGTGKFWLDDVELYETTAGEQWLPEVATAGIRNMVPNSGFECGPANWGSFTYGLSGWAGNLYRLEGAVDTSIACQGRQSLKIALGPRNLPEFWFDYYEPVRQPVRRVLAANRGWFRVAPGEKLTLSAFLRADTEGVVAQMAVIGAPDHLQTKPVTVGRDWLRAEYTFASAQPFIFVAVGLDLEATKREAATLWVDAIQLERGERATAYEPRLPVESFLQVASAASIFTNAAQGGALSVLAYNHAAEEKALAGVLAISDFFDRSVAEFRPRLTLAPQSHASYPLEGLCRGRRGYFRASWSPDAQGADRPPDPAESSRFAIIDPVGPGAPDSFFGFNHAYPWDFLVGLARQAGVVWWRDWSAKWQTVEPTKGTFDFRIPDEQIRRVLNQDGEVAVLLPFPSTDWATTARQDEVAKEAGDNAYLQARLPVAYAPRDLKDFGQYASRVLRRYSAHQPRGVKHIQILNEPIYTTYALPRQFGYVLPDYVRLLETAYGALKAADPACRVVGGISTGPESKLTRDFIVERGLRFLDILDVHIYDAPRSAESYERPFETLQGLMRTHGGAKPIWVSEWGCYADDDPACVPPTVGDETMNRCRWPSERAATEHMVKFAAVALAHGVRKVFFHAGTCGAINGPDAGGVLFEYGGAPRRMYPGVAAFSRVVGVPGRFVQKVEQDGLSAYVFAVNGSQVAVAWGAEDRPRKLRLVSGVSALDIMGNELPRDDRLLNGTPVYLCSTRLDDLLAVLR